MRKVLFGVFVSATLGLPCVSFAKSARLYDNSIPSRQGQRSAFQQGNPGGPTIGGAYTNVASTGHVTGPGVARVDNDSRAPINDIQPGRGTEDTPQSKNPKPIY